MSPWKCHVSHVTIGGEKRELSKPKYSREGKRNPEISLSLSVNAGEKWLTFFYGVPHQYSELFFHSPACIWLPAPQMPPVLGRHKVLLLAVVLNLGCKLESPGGAVPHPDVPSASQKNWVGISRLRVSWEADTDISQLPGDSSGQTRLRPNTRLGSFHQIDAWPPLTWIALMWEIQHFLNIGRQFSIRLLRYVNFGIFQNQVLSFKLALKTTKWNNYWHLLLLHFCP